MIAVCSLCPHQCKIEQDKTGICFARTNNNGAVIDSGYGLLTAIALDPVEKKPLVDFYPGSTILSIGSYGCNMKCSFCQNWQIAACGADGVNALYMPPGMLVQEAESFKNRGNIGVAYTYNEPLVNYEYVYDCAVLVREAGMKNVLVTSAMINSEPFANLIKYIDAANIDLKSFDAGFYRKAGGYIETVKENIKIAASKIHLEVTTLIIEGLNDSPADMERECEWLAGIDKNIILHLTRFFPNYKLQSKPATSKEKMYKLKEIASGYLNRVYLGNM